MEETIFNIGIHRYLLTICFGKHRQIVKETIEEKIEQNEINSTINYCDYIVTMGKSFVILTIPKNFNTNNRTPLVIKPWCLLEFKKNTKTKYIYKHYVDNEGYNWIYKKKNNNESITYFMDDKKIVYLKISY